MSWVGAEYSLFDSSLAKISEPMETTPAQYNPMHDFVAGRMIYNPLHNLLYSFQQCLESMGHWFPQRSSFWTEKSEFFNFIVIFASGKSPYPLLIEWIPTKLSLNSILSWNRLRWLIVIANLAEPFLTNCCRTKSSIFKSILDSSSDSCFSRAVAIVLVFDVYLEFPCTCIDLIKTHSSNEHPPNTGVLPPFTFVKIRITLFPRLIILSKLVLASLYVLHVLVRRFVSRVRRIKCRAPKPWTFKQIVDNCTFKGTHIKSLKCNN